MKNYKIVPKWMLDLPEKFEDICFDELPEGAGGTLRFQLDSFFKKRPDESLLAISSDAANGNYDLWIGWTEKTVLFRIPGMTGDYGDYILSYLPRNPEKIYKEME